MIYIQRKHGRPGVYLALATPTPGGFDIEYDSIVWSAPAPTQHETSAGHAEWTRLRLRRTAPSPCPADGTLLAVFWCIQKSGSGIRMCG